MKRMTLAAALAFVLLAVSRPARADSDLTAGFGEAFPQGTNGFNRLVKSGPAGGVEYIHQIWGPFGLGASLDSLGFRALRQQSAQFSSSESASAASLEGVVRIAPFHRYGFGPYLLGGAGWNRFAAKTKTTPNPGFAWSDTGTTETRAASAASIGFASVVGAGFEAVLFRSGFTVGAEARWSEDRVSRAKFGAGVERAFSAVGRIGVHFF